MNSLAPSRAAWWLFGLEGGAHARLVASRATMLVGVAVVITLLAGCAADHGSRTVEYDYESPRELQAPARADWSAERPVVAAPLPPKTVTFDIPDDSDPALGGASPESRRLAEQSQRDVELLLAARPGGNGGVATDGSGGGVAAAETNDQAASGSTASAALGSQVAPPRRAIEWNDPPKAPIRTEPSGAPQQPSATSVAEPPVSPAADPSTLVTAKSVAQVATLAAPAPDPTTLRPDRIKQLTVDLARELYAEGAYSEHPLRELSYIAAMSMHDPQRRLDADSIPDLTDDERVVLANLQTFFTSVGDTLETASDVNAGVAQAAATLRSSLVDEPQLTLPTISLCTRVGGFGDYSPFERSVFLAATDQKAIVYLEIDDFVSEINQDDEFVTELSQQLMIYSDRDGALAWKEDWQTATDISRKKRQDFFTTQIVTLPRALGVGKYTLKVRVRDEKSSAEAETSVPFEIVADPKLIQ